MLNWIRAVSGAVSNLPSAPTKTVLGNAVSVGAWATANAASMRTAQRMRASDFTGFLRRGQLYTDINRTREIVKVAWVVGREGFGSGKALTAAVPLRHPKAAVTAAVNAASPTPAFCQKLGVDVN